MTPNQITLLRETWDAIVPNADAVARQFYRNLFEIDPGAAGLFSGTNMARQRAMLLGALGQVVEKADQTKSLVPALEEMGRRHVQYGVEDRHYASVGAALIGTLEQGLGSAFTDDVRAAWMAAYALVSSTMQRAAAETGEASS